MIFCRDLKRAYFTHVMYINCKIGPFSAIQQKEIRKECEIYVKLSGSAHICLLREISAPQGITRFDDIEIKKCRQAVSRGTKGHTFATLEIQI